MTGDSGSARALARTLARGAWLRAAKDARDFVQFARRANAVRGVFASFEAAARSAPRDRKVGYDHPGHAEMYDHRLGQVLFADYPVLFWISRLLPGVSSVFDFGGHVGLLYYGFAKRLSFPPGFRWLVCDVPGTVERGRALAERSAAGALRFTTEWADGDGADVLLASGVLQYVEGALAERLRSWKRLPPHVIVSNTPMYEGSSYVTLQNTHLSYNPYRVFNRAELFASLQSLGYVVEDTWRSDRSLRVPFHPERTVDSYQGAYFRLGPG